MTYDEIKRTKKYVNACEREMKTSECWATQIIRRYTARWLQSVPHIFKKFGYSEEDIKLVKIAGFMHDIGNVVNRKHHAEYGAILANEILKRLI